MKYIVRKAYWNYEKEERYLNEMSAKGLALTDYSWCRYVFEEAPAGKYIYRIELLENLSTHPESIAYIKFLEESGIECVATYMRWIYLRKEAADGPFDLFTDINSKIKHISMVRNFFTTLMFLEFSVGLLNITLGLTQINERVIKFPVNMAMGILLFLLGLIFYVTLVRPNNIKIKRLLKERKIHE